MKKNLLSTITVTTAIFVALFGASPSYALSLKAKSVNGYDKLSGKVKKSKDCSFALDPDLKDPAMNVGVQSQSAPYNNFLVRIPNTDIPLNNGYSKMIAAGIKATYSEGVLTVLRKTTGDGEQNSQESMILEVSNDLKTITRAQVLKTAGFKKKETVAQMTCLF